MNVDKKITILVVDDSALMRKMISDILNADSRIEVVATAQNARIALRKIEQYKPDIMTLDIDMPGMDGYTLLNRIMKECPLPVVVLSGLTQEGAALTVRCLEAGAIEVIPKPLATFCRDITPVAKELIKSIISISRSQIHLTLGRYRKKIASKKEVLPETGVGGEDVGKNIIAIGISTGGPSALAEIFPKFPERTPPIFVVQHMPPNFTKALADRLNSISKITVKEAENKEIIKKNVAYIAPGNYHMVVGNDDGICKIILHKEKRIYGVRPSVDVLFKSMASIYGKRVRAIIMTGMGRDGVTGLKAIRSKGGITFAQDKHSCVVYGMPKIAMEEDCVDEEVKLEDIAAKLMGG